MYIYIYVRICDEGVTIDLDIRPRQVTYSCNSTTITKRFELKSPSQVVTTSFFLALSRSVCSTEGDTYI